MLLLKPKTLNLILSRMGHNKTRAERQQIQPGSARAPQGVCTFGVSDEKCIATTQRTGGRRGYVAVLVTLQRLITTTTYHHQHNYRNDQHNYLPPLAPRGAHRQLSALASMRFGKFSASQQRTGRHKGTKDQTPNPRPAILDAGGGEIHTIHGLKAQDGQEQGGQTLTPQPQTGSCRR